MFSNDSKYITLPVFPLNYLVLPGEQKELHIFEARYKELIRDCLQNNACFGIVLPKKLKGGVSDYGVLVRIVRVNKTHPSGELDIVVEGINVFKTVKFVSVLSPKLYGAATAEMIYHQENFCSEETLNLFQQYTEATSETGALLSKETTIFQLAERVGLSSEERLKLASFLDDKQREELLRGKLRLLIKVCEIEKKLNGDFWLN